MSLELDFDFTDTELFAAFRLVASDEVAREQTNAVREAWAPGMDWAASRELLLLISLGTTSGREKVERLRRVGQVTRVTVAVRAATGGDLPADELVRRVREGVEAEDRHWEEERSAMRRALLEEGRELADDHPHGSGGDAAP